MESLSCLDRRKLQKINHIFSIIKGYAVSCEGPLLFGVECGPAANFRDRHSVANIRVTVAAAIASLRIV